MHCSHGLFFGEQISRSGQRWSNTNHDINLQLKFKFSNVQHHNLYHVEGFWQSSTCCMNHPYSRCGQVSILNNPRMAWEKETHGKKVTGLQIAIVEELSVCGTAGEHSKQKSFWREEHLYIALFAHSLELQPLVKRCVKFTDVEIERGAFTLHARTLKPGNATHKWTNLSLTTRML